MAKTPPLHLDDPVVGLAGDWHANLTHIQWAIPALRRANRDTRSVLHVGDFGIWPGGEGKRYIESVEYWCRRTNLTLYVTPGNHEDWDQLDAGYGAFPGSLFWVSEHVCMLPRGYRFTIGNHTALSFGGAASVDKSWRLTYRGKHPIWWEHEIATEEEVQHAVSGGPADVLLTHEPGYPALWEVSQDRIDLDITFRDADRIGQAVDQVNQVREAAAPKLHLHGHRHVWDEGDVELPNGHVVHTVALNKDHRPGNLALLDTTTLRVTRLLDRAGR